MYFCYVPGVFCSLLGTLSLRSSRLGLYKERAAGGVPGCLLNVCTALEDHLLSFIMEYEIGG